MKKVVILLAVSMVLFAGVASSQKVVITDFPVGVGGSADEELFKPYYPALQEISDTLHKYPMARAIVTGGADGEQYRHNNDAKNPGLALGRAHTLRNLLINEFKVDSAQIIIQSEDSKPEGGNHRFASVRVDRELAELETRVAAVENRPPVEKHFTEVKEFVGDSVDVLGLQFGLGFSSSPFGGIPVATSAIAWKRTVYVEGVVGHTFWNSTYQYLNADLSTKRRLIGGQVIVYPWENLRLGILGGWVRIEEIAQDYYAYVKLSEGPMLGLRAMPFEFLSITGTYNPSKQREAGARISKAVNDQFLISIAAHIAFGGAK
jgi:hypothetical protein